MRWLGWILVASLAWRLWVAVARTRDRLDAVRDHIDLTAIRLYLENLRAASQLPAWLVFDDPRGKKWKRVRGPKRFVQFYADVGAQGRCLVFDFPKAPWSEPFLPILRDVLNSKRYPMVETSEAINVSDLEVDDAVDLIDLVFREVFGCGEVRAQVFGNGNVAGIDLPNSEPA